ncbi:MAG: glyoxalase [Gammaproteobacteria bacterium]|nr:MAG: glyoxalase [Gammaproteobacteria bacterium]
MNVHGKLNYVEYPALNLEKTKEFFQKSFGWEFQDFGTEYTSFFNQGLNGGFFKSELSSTTKTGGALLVFFSDNLQETLASIKNAGGIITKPVFEFPGGRRFHFIEPSGNEFAVWSDK